MMLEPVSDPIEQLEAWEERMVEKYMNPDGTFNCAGCGKKIPAGKCRQAGAAPYGVPVCEQCELQERIDDD